MQRMWSGFSARAGFLSPVRPSGAAAVPPVPGLQFQVESYAGKVKALSILWFIYAGFSLLMGSLGWLSQRRFSPDFFAVAP